MNNRLDILNELKELAPGLVNVSQSMPYHLPEGYFESFPVLMTARVIPPATLQMDVPEGYFENFAANMLAKIKAGGAVTEMADPAILAGISREPVQAVPPTYFEDFAGQMLALVQAAQAEPVTPLLSSIDKRPVQFVPEGYAENFAAGMLVKLQQQTVEAELEGIAPILNTISKKPVNFVPDGYFEQLLPVTGTQKVTAAPVISIRRKNNWLKYAVAACAAGVMFTVGYNILNKTDKIDPAYNPLVLNKINVQDSLDKIDVSAIEQYLDNTTIGGAQTAASFDPQTDDIDSYLQTISTDELQQYLKENPLPAGNKKS